MKPRYEVEAGINDCLIIRDSHNQDLTSLTKHALGFLEQQSANQNMHRTLIVSDIDGNDLVCEMFYVNIQQVIRTNTVDRIVFLGPDLHANADMFDIGDKLFFDTAGALLTSGFIETLHHEAILVKIAQEYEPERILNHIRQLAHDTVLEINFDALFHNIDHFRSKISKDTLLMCMMKASAYGSGSIEVSQALQHYGVDYIAVAFTNEGVEIRQAGIKIPILVLDPMLPALPHMFKYNLEPEVCSFQFLTTVIDEAKRRGLRDYPIHIKLDTGMHRAGFVADDLDLLVNIIKSQNAVKIKSVFSHLAAADEFNPDFERFTLSQISLFDRLSAQLQSSFGHKILRHILNTAGIERFSEHQFDMVRLGIGLWGHNCCNTDMLRNVCSLQTRIMQLKMVSAGETVGYSRKGVCDTDRLVALLPLGYADGIDRRLGNGNGSVYINGKEVKTIGNICMDLMMIDVTDMDVNVGDKVVIFDDQHSIANIANKLGTIPYEVLSGISPRVRRVYFRN